MSDPVAHATVRPGIGYGRWLLSSRSRELGTSVTFVLDGGRKPGARWVESHLRACADRSTGGPFEQEYIYTFEQTGEGKTRLTQVVETEPGGFFRLVGPLLERAGSRQLRADLQSLKDLMEARAET